MARGTHYNYIETGTITSSRISEKSFYYTDDRYRNYTIGGYIEPRQPKRTEYRRKDGNVVWVEVNPDGTVHVDPEAMALLLSSIGYIEANEKDK